MRLSWSHAVLYVQDKDRMLDFYSTVLGFQITDRGPLAPDGPEVIFLSQDPQEHHQIGMVDTKANDDPPNSVNHFAFRVATFGEVKDLHQALTPLDGIEITPLSHGNALSIYFNDPEGNGLEVFWDTPWHVAQPMARPWDPTMDETQAVAWVEAEFSDAPGFGPKEDYVNQREAELAN